MKKSISAVILVAFFFSTIKSPAYAQLDPMPFMPNPGVMVHLSPEFSPAYLKGIIIHPENPLKFDFIFYKGDKDLNDVQKREEYTKLTKYFLASLAIPDDDQWVNLSPYEKDRIIKNDFGKTEMGRDLLAQDYMLKQITASLIYPEDNLGRKFWDKVYSQAQEKFGTSNIPVNTFNKVWILPDDAEIYEKGNTAFVFKSHLKVMLEEDYLSLQKHAGIQSVPMDNKTHTIASKIVKEIILPELENEVNEGKNFASLRQVFSGMILAAWYKRALKESFLSQIYANKSMVKGVDQDPRTNALIFQEYLKAYKKGVFNFIKEDVDKYTNETIPRKYFSGGVGVDAAVLTRAIKRFPANNLMAEQATTREVLGQGEKYDITVVLADEINDAAMMVAPQKLLQDQSVKTVAGNDKEVEIFYNTNALRLGSKSGKALYDFNTNFNNSTRAFVVWGQFVLIMDAHSFRVIYLKTKTSHLDVPLDSFFLGLGVKNINQSFEDRGFLLSNDRKTVIGVRNMTLFPVGKLLMLESANNGIKSFQLNKSNLKYLKTLFLFGNDRAMVNTSPRVLEPGRPQSIVAVNGQEVPIRYYTFKAADAKEEDKDVLQIGQEIAIPLMSKHDTKNRQVIISGHYVFLLDGQMFSIYKLLNEKDYFEIPKEAYLQFFTNFRNPQAVLKKRGFLISDKIIQLLGVGGVKLDAQNKKIILKISFSFSILFRWHHQEYHLQLEH